MSKRYGIVVVKKDGTAHMLIHDLTSEDQAVAIGKRLTALGLDGLGPADDPGDPPVEVWEYDERDDGYGIGWVDLRYAPVGEFEFINKNRRSGEEYGDWLDQSLRYGPAPALRPYSVACSNAPMGDVRRPSWWAYPVACQHGHPWGPGRVAVGWV